VVRLLEPVFWRSAGRRQRWGFGGNPEALEHLGGHFAGEMGQDSAMSTAEVALENVYGKGPAKELGPIQGLGAGFGPTRFVVFSWSCRKGPTNAGDDRLRWLTAGAAKVGSGDLRAR
jgi:hypothetical protein